MKEFINTLSTNDKIIVVFSMIMLAISITELIMFAIRFWYAVIVYQKKKRLPDHRISGYRYINSIERLRSYTVINALAAYFVIVFGISDILILKGYIVMTTTVVFIEEIMYILCVNFGFMLKVNVNKKDYFRPRLSAYNPKADDKCSK